MSTEPSNIRTEDPDTMPDHLQTNGGQNVELQDIRLAIQELAKEVRELRQAVRMSQLSGNVVDRLP